jgi:hypothetical protein
MKKLFVMMLLLAPALAFGQLEWRVSIKVFTGSGGALPRQPGWGSGGLYQSLSNGVAYANAILDASCRGYRWRLVEILPVPGSTAAAPASTNSWFNVAVSGATQDDLDGKAKANPGGFILRNNAINFYYTDNNNSPNGGYCAFPTENQNVILIAPDSFADVFLHESGHFFGLLHTFDSAQNLNNNNTPCTNGCACAKLVGGDDNIPDTPLDHTCWNQDNVALTAYGTVYAMLNSGQQYFVDNTWSNVMSYHSPGNRFTSDQLDVMADNSNGARNNAASGFSRFVDGTGNFFFQFGSSAFPYLTVATGISSANNGDIVLIRPGSYNEPMTITKPVTLRATRGSATIGVP